MLLRELTVNEKVIPTQGLMMNDAGWSLSECLLHSMHFTIAVAFKVFGQASLSYEIRVKVKFNSAMLFGLEIKFIIAIVITTVVAK